MQKDGLVNGSIGRVLRFIHGPLESNAKIAGVEKIGRHEPETSIAARARILQWESVDSDRTWPLVRFMNEKERIITPHVSTVENALGGVEAIREQVAIRFEYFVSPQY